MADLWLPGVFFQALNTPKLVFGGGSAPSPVVGCGGGHSLPHTLPQRPLETWRSSKHYHWRSGFYVQNILPYT